jgi:hypothetical protein
VVEVEVVVSVVLVDVVSSVVVALVVLVVVVRVLVDDSAVVLVVEGVGGPEDEVPPPQCWAFPLLPSLPQLPLSGFPPVPGVLLVGSTVAVFGPALPLPPGPSFGG